MGQAAHEFIHALGFWHEQSRFDRDKFVRINSENIISGQQFNFDKHTTGVELFDLPYDLASIMHYGSREFSKNDQPTIEALSGFELLPAHIKTSLSKNDIVAIQKLYGCNAVNNFLDYKLFFLLLIISLFNNSV